jgi:predicted dehydrogenase
VRAAPAYWRIMVFGTKGWAEARDETALTTALVGRPPETKVYPAVDSLGTILEAFAETIETGKPFIVSNEDMLDVAGAFEAIIRSMEQGAPVMVTRG